ncbi:uncharacterized protein LOC144133317 [Amblyomma americanum]
MGSCRELRGFGKGVIYFDRDAGQCRTWKASMNCLSGRNRFYDEAFCFDACSGERPWARCFESVRIRTCIPGRDTNTSAFHYYDGYCYAVERGYCIKTPGFNSEEECTKRCKGSVDKPHDCESAFPGLCEPSAHIYKAAFFRGSCVKHNALCPLPLNFTSLDECNRKCRRPDITIPVPEPER